jgi:MEMO1 family protein
MRGSRSSWRTGPAGLAIVALLLACGTACSDTPRPPAVGTVREAAVAGQFYPREPKRLRAAVDAYLAGALPARPVQPIALVVPHAGLAYSGQIAADGFRQAAAARPELVVVLGTHHTTADFGGVALYPGTGLRTPLGVVASDTGAVRRLLAADPLFRADAGPHDGEHSIEVELPFIQVLFPDARVVAAVVGTEDPGLCSRAGAALGRVLRGRRALVVASSDLSHYPPYAEAVASDRAVLAALCSLDSERFAHTIATQMHARRPGLETCACGEGAILVAMAAARAQGATHGIVVSAANSGETLIGDRSRVVGYGAVALVAGPGAPDTSALAPVAPPAADVALDDSSQARLLAFARQTLAEYLAGGALPLPRGMPPVAARLQGAFVTLQEHGELRGCIGHMAEDMPLGQVVGGMALAAAFEDRRFPPVEARELPALSIEISVLTPLERVRGPEDVVIGRDGVEIRKDGHAGVFLPEVAVEQGWDLEALMGNLCLKAGLPTDAWKHGADLFTFRTVHFSERRPATGRK